MAEAFARYPIPLDDPNATKKLTRLRNANRPRLKDRPDALLKRERVPAQQRRAFLKALGFS